ncbi:MAG: radical SAM protein [Candidatus Bathyarchaeota archaeon]|nr:radical SAM protein [Candidatus Termiticorpusculum sp.]
MSLISRFDPWQSGLCTCPQKLTFNPYTGCDHKCLYCYASSYIAGFNECKPKKDLIERLKREAPKLSGEIISLSNSSDPYPKTERSTGLTRQCLDILTKNNCRIQIITKSNLVIRDDDLLKQVPSTVTFTITTDDDQLAQTLEPNAPSPSQRLSAAEDLISQDIPVSVRIDPIIPFINDQPKKLVKTLAAIGVKHITSSTYKVKPDNWKRLATALKPVAEKLEPLYFKEGERVGGNILLHKDLRMKILKNVRDLADAEGIKFGCCREGLERLNTAPCDSSWLLPKTNNHNNGDTVV